jgi:hypothetical protein
VAAVVLLALAFLHRRSWRRLFCRRRLCGWSDCDGLSAALKQREEQREANVVAAVVRTDSAALLALASLHRRSWRRLFCRRLCGGGGVCDVGGAVGGVGVAAAGGAAGSNTVAAGVSGSAYRAQARNETCPRRQEQRQWQQQRASKTT